MAAARRDPAIPPSLLRKRMVRTLQVVVALFFFNFFALPQLALLKDSYYRLRQVNGLLLLLGLAFELAALIAYSEFTRVALRDEAIPLRTLVRIQLSTKAVTNLVPGGSAAGSAMGYRMLTVEGVSPEAAGFALATVGLGSAVVLNLLLWTTLLVSIPFAGFNPVYVTTALVGVFLLGAFGAIVVALIRGADRAERIVRAIAGKFSFVDPDRVGSIVRRLGLRLREMGNDPRRLRRMIGWASANWILDALSLWVFLAAFGAHVRPDSLIVAFGVANVTAAIPVTPGGLGVIEITLSSMLAFFGVPAAAVGFGVPAYRLAAFWLPIPLGAFAYFSLRVGPWSSVRSQSLRGLRDEAATVLETGESVYDWADRMARSSTHPVLGGVDRMTERTVVINAERADPDHDATGPIFRTEPPRPAPVPKASSPASADASSDDPDDPGDDGDGDGQHPSIDDLA